MEQTFAIIVIGVCILIGVAILNMVAMLWVLSNHIHQANEDRINIYEAIFGPTEEREDNDQWNSPS